MGFSITTFGSFFGIFELFENYNFDYGVWMLWSFFLMMSAMFIIQMLASETAVIAEQRQSTQTVRDLCVQIDGIKQI